jgi:flagellar operon protein
VLGRELQQTQPVRFSAHALQRLEDRGLQFSEEEHQQIVDAVRQIAEKGGRESVLVMDKAALVVSIPNRTVITAVSRDELDNNVFTNIDSVVIVPPVSATQNEQETIGPAPVRGGLDAADRLMRHTV